MKEIKSLLEDRFWRLNHLYWIQDANGRKVKFRMNWAQLHFYREIWYLNEILKVRQIGMSTLIGIMLLDHALFSRDQACGIIDRTDKEAVKKLTRVAYAYDHLDDVDDPQTARLGLSVKQAVGLRTHNQHEMTFSNGSQIWAGTTLRGSTVNFLHVSELGYIAHHDPKRADEIAAGTFNTVHAGNLICVEATHEGGRYGMNYELIRQAQKFDFERATPLDWKFHFFPWWGEPSYILDLQGFDLKVPLEAEKYFSRLESDCRVKLTPEQKHWWIKKKDSPRVDMARQYPGTVEEALTALTEGAIYGPEIARLRAVGRVTDFEPDSDSPLFTSWDIGQSDYHAIWLFQIRRMDFLFLDYFTGQRASPGELVSHINLWERHYDRPIVRHFLPHDADSATAVNKTMRQALAEANLRNVTIVPRTPDVWNGIKHLRSILPSCYFHATNCDKEREIGDGRILPSGLGALEGYHMKIDVVGGKLTEQPVHDGASHGSDGIRTFAEAHMKGMIEKYLKGIPGAVSPYGSVLKNAKAKVTRGIRNPSVFSGSKQRSGTRLTRTIDTL